MKSLVSAVACMRLLGRDSSPGSRGARHTHDTRLATRPDELDHAPLVTRNLPPATLGPKTFSSRLGYESGLTPGITRRPASLPEFEITRVGGRVHAVVMRHLRRSYIPSQYFVRPPRHPQARN